MRSSSARSIRALLNCTLIAAAALLVISTADAAGRMPRGPRVIRGSGAVAAAKAAEKIGSNVYIAIGSSMPVNMIRPMRQVAEQRHGQTGKKTGMYWMSTFAAARNFSPENSKFLDHTLFFVSSGNREAATAGRAKRLPNKNSLFEVAQRLEKGEFPIDTVVVRVSKPKKVGRRWMVSLGPTGDLTMPAINSVLKRGGKIIAEVNENVPFTEGANKLHWNKVAVAYRADKADVLGGFAPGVSTPLTKAIAKNIRSLVPAKGQSTAQVGIGGALVDVADSFKGTSVRRIWSEMGSDWVKPLMQGRQIKEATFSFLLGDSSLYAVAGKDKRIKIDSSNAVNNPQVIAKQPNMLAVNTALEVNFRGDVGSEMIGKRVITSPGGQPNFMQGASLSESGKAIMAIRSTNKFGHSTIVPRLNGKVTTPKKWVDHVVTEWGTTARLRGLNDKQRTAEILKVSHPLHRKDLAKQALGNKLIDRKQYSALVKSIPATIAQADPDTGLRRYIADQAKAKRLITPAQHKAIVAELKRVAPNWANPVEMPPPLQPEPLRR